MAFMLKNLCSFSQILKKSSSVICVQHRNASHWMKDFIPGPYPNSPSLRKAAACKYRILPELYKPFPDEGLYYGDYPDIEAGPDNLGIEAKDDFYPYDYPEHKRNFNDPVHAEIDLYNETRWSLPEKPRLKNWQYWASFLGVMAFCIVFYYSLENKKMFRPVLKKQFYEEGVVHYTFEPKA